nr:EOG090X0ASS [Cyclestheria hislopi]
MGLCKCPKRKVTNQFCFEHRVNVCEHCMVANHPKCVIQSYLLWLKDSDYNAICTLCSADLQKEECVRLICYHVFHLKCLDEHCRQYPSNTAPAGFVCPSCSGPVFPPPNLVSPVADSLRQLLQSRPWAREGLGLPLLPFEENHITTETNVPQSNIENNMKSTGPPYSVVEMDSSTFHRNEQVIQSKRATVLPSGPDHDEDKYKRRPPWEAFKRLLSNSLHNLSMIHYSRDPGGKHKIILPSHVLQQNKLLILWKKNFDNSTYTKAQDNP